MQTQLAFDFDGAVAQVVRRPTPQQLKEEAATKAVDDYARERARQQKPRDEALEYWKVGMVTNLPIFATVLDSQQRYTQMLPGVVESIDNDHASVRIYAAPEYGYTIDGYPLHGKLAVEVPLIDLGVYHNNHELEKLVIEGRLSTGDAELGERIRKRTNYRRWI